MINVVLSLTHYIVIQGDEMIYVQTDAYEQPSPATPLLQDETSLTTAPDEGSTLNNVRIITRLILRSSESNSGWDIFGLLIIYTSHKS